ncbi:MAG: circadian clock protein KaiA [Cyanobacteria bacterium M_surface_7_m2_040]|nr:circadian clock protein KaiA [Cyanobacteria bacterium M_surface_9_m1_291]MBM5827374.1 circadian clock protein KaiA [Cyanobacteria bacterium M_surface_7_m2_040]
MQEPQLILASLVVDPRLQQACGLWLKGGRYRLLPPPDALAAGTLAGPQLDQVLEQVDAVLIEEGVLAAASIEHLLSRGLRLPAVVIGAVSGRVTYHEGEVHLPPDQLEQLTYSLDAAFARVLSQELQGLGGGDGAQTAEVSEGWKLGNRLKERLGLLGVFYKRDPDRFLRQLGESERRDLLNSLERTYRDLLLSYFRDPAVANQALESFVNTAFFSDLPITKTVEIHMNLIDGFSKQLKLEGHRTEFLQDYRLALLDVMAHLCEMYRRSIPADAPITLPASSGTEVLS